MELAAAGVCKGPSIMLAGIIQSTYAQIRILTYVFKNTFCQ